MLLYIRDTNWAPKHLTHDLHTWSFVSLLFFCLSAALTTLTEGFSDGLSWELMTANEQGGPRPKQSGRKWSEKLQFLSLGASITSMNVHHVHSLYRETTLILPHQAHSSWTHNSPDPSLNPSLTLSCERAEIRGLGPSFKAEKQHCLSGHESSVLVYIRAQPFTLDI